MFHDVWGWIGALGQTMFASRFAVQWVASEVRGHSVIPEYFWWASVFGGAGLLIYAIHIHDPIFIVGQAAGLLVYARNLTLRHAKGAHT